MWRCFSLHFSVCPAKNMRIAQIGTGRMGAAVAQAAAARDWMVVERFDDTHPFSLERAAALTGRADVAIDFSGAVAAFEHVATCCRAGLPLVIGTTGWNDRMEEARRLVQQMGGSVLFAPNFSLGVALMERMLRAAIPLLDRLPSFDVSIHEVHHTGKADRPSGTALRLGRLLVDGISRKSDLETTAGPGRVDPSALVVTAARTGFEFGHHTVWIDGPHDRITLSHDARSRLGFAEGALTAAAWLQGRTGFFTLDDLLDDWLTVHTP